VRSHARERAVVPRCAGLLLAAGAGSRLGTPKALVSVGGELLVDRGARMLADGGCAPVVVVLGARAADVTARADLEDAVVVVNDAWADGIGSSLRVGLRALADLGADSAVIALADQPRIGADVVRRLLAAPAVTPAVVASYGGKPGNPVRLDASVWPEVAAAATGDVGARAWMRAHPEHVQAVACDDLGSDVDIDTREDLIRLEGSEPMEPKA
jgi:CTP:molybdopterin cytidylyltransferase MocA